MISPKKSLGQHFLQDENVVRKIVGSLALHREDIVVEIGPGRGELTKHLVECSDHVVGVEVDPRAVALLQDILADQLVLVKKDVLKVSLEEFSRRYGRKLRVVGNIPYYITSEILFHLFQQRDELLDATLMMQLEVARRLTAKPRSKEYGILSVFTQFYAKPELLFRVSRNSFYPRPNVDSAVVSLKFGEPLPATNISLFKNIVRSTFGKRRKTLRNGLKAMGLQNEAIKQLEFDISKRPEELSVDDFLSLTSSVEPFSKNLTDKF